MPCRIYSVMEWKKGIFAENLGAICRNKRLHGLYFVCLSRVRGGYLMESEFPCVALLKMALDVVGTMLVPGTMFAKHK